MAGKRDVIPEDRLPAGFAQRIDAPPHDPPVPAPAATVVLARPTDAAFEVLLLKRHRDSGFVPGAFVFAGGRVDPADANAELIARTDGMAAEPEPAYWMAAAREAFEETGLLLGVRADGVACTLDHENPALPAWRASLMADQATLLDVLSAEDVRLDFHRTAYCAHWITPIPEPRRYDTRFFLTEVDADCDAVIDEREMSECVWLTPAAALQRFEDGTLPMVFPTVRTLEELAGFDTMDEALQHYRNTTIEPVLPRFVRRYGGIGIEIDPTKEDA